MAQQTDHNLLAAEIAALELETFEIADYADDEPSFAAAVTWTLPCSSTVAGC